MKILSKYKKASLSFFSVFALLAMLFAGNAGIAFADSDREDKSEKKEKVEFNLSEKLKNTANRNTDLHINANGKVNLQGATVVSVSSSSLVARITFGSLNMDWTVVMDSNTKVTREKDGVAVIGDIKAGDVVKVKGNLDTTATTPTIKATHVKDLSLGAGLKGNLFQGKLVSLTSSTTPATAVVNLDGTNYTVSIPTGISILKSNWLPTTLASFQVGNVVRIYGSVSSTTPPTISASVIRNLSL